MISIREATPADAAAMLALKQTLDRETRFMLVEPDERTSGEEDERVHLAALNAQTNSVVLVADDAGALVGYVEASGGEFRRNHRTAYVVIGVVAGHAGSGIGSGLLAALDVWAATAGVHRLELTVMAHNQAAIGLYRKMGYQVEGTRRAALVIDAEFIDELWMAKLLDPPSVEAASRG